MSKYYKDLLKKIEESDHVKDVVVTKEEFSLAVEDYAHMNNKTMLTSCVYMMDLLQVSYKRWASVISKTLKDKIEVESIKLNLLRKNNSNSFSVLSFSQ